MQVAKVGSYKSATEMFTGDKMSDADREQTEAYINGIWQNVTQAVATSRKISVATLNQYADSLITFAAPQDYVKMKMVDQLLYTDQVKKEIKKRLNLKDDEKIKQVTVNDMTKAKGAQTDGDEIAVYYAYGNIVDGVVGDMTSREHVIDAQTVCKDLEELTNDDDVKAVVLRINSGGGSAYASEQIWHQLMELKKKKPVVVSMGGMAASGGYYISAPANWIVAEPTTLTGSIGIFGMFPDMSGLLTEKIGVKFDEVKTNKNSAFGTRARPFTPEEMSILEKYVDRGYKLFRQRVAEGRKMTTDQVEQIAQGHVWIGQDAMKIKLVDELGGIEKAINKAAALAKIKDFHTQSYPAQTDWITQLMDRMEGSNYLDEQMRVTLGEYYDVFSTMKTMNQQSAIQARIPYYIYVR
jgi:protease-4